MLSIYIYVFIPVYKCTHVHPISMLRDWAVNRYIIYNKRESYEFMMLILPIFKRSGRQILRYDEAIRCWARRLILSFSRIHRRVAHRYIKTKSLEYNNATIKYTPRTEAPGGATERTTIIPKRGANSEMYYSWGGWSPSRLFESASGRLTRDKRSTVAGGRRRGQFGSESELGATGLVLWFSTTTDGHGPPLSLADGPNNGQTYCLVIVF